MVKRVDIPQNDYGVGSRTFAPNFGQAEKSFRVTFSRVAWPAGPCLVVRITWDNGEFQQFSFNGGIQLKEGPTIGEMVERTESDFTISKPAGVTGAVILVTTLQPITTAVLGVSA